MDAQAIKKVLTEILEEARLNARVLEVGPAHDGTPAAWVQIPYGDARMSIEITGLAIDHIEDAYDQPLMVFFREEEPQLAHA